MDVGVGPGNSPDSSDPSNSKPANAGSNEAGRHQSRRADPVYNKDPALPSTASPTTIERPRVDELHTATLEAYGLNPLRFNPDEATSEQLQLAVYSRFGAALVLSSVRELGEQAVLDEIDSILCRAYQSADENRMLLIHPTFQDWNAFPEDRQIIPAVAALSERLIKEEPLDNIQGFESLPILEGSPPLARVAHLVKVEKPGTSDETRTHELFIQFRELALPHLIANAKRIIPAYNPRGPIGDVTEAETKDERNFSHLAFYLRQACHQILEDEIENAFPQNEFANVVNDIASERGLPEIIGLRQMPAPANRLAILVRWPGSLSDMLNIPAIAREIEFDIHLDNLGRLSISFQAERDLDISLI